MNYLSVDNSSAVNYGYTFNPLDKLRQAHDEQIRFYERLVQAEKDKVEYLEKLLKK